MNLYKLKDVRKSYGRHFTLDVPHLSIKEGGLHVIYGPNASGKSTLLNILGLLMGLIAGLSF